MSLPGGINPRRVDQYTAAGTPPPSPAPQGGTIRAQSVIITGTQGEVLAYSGPAATGNLIGSVAAAQFTDAKGNLVLRGITNYFNNTPNNPAFIAVQMFDGALSVLSAPGPGGPYTSVGQVQLGGSGSFSIGGPGITNIGGGLDSLTFGNGYPQALFANLAGSLVNSQADATPVTVTTATAITRISKAYTVPANNPQIVNTNTHYRVKFSGTGAMGAVAVAFSFVCAIGATGSLDWDLTWPASTLAANNTFQYCGEVDIYVTSTGVSGTWDISGWMILTDVTTGNSAVKALVDTGNTHDTTINETVEIDFQWAATSAGRTVTNLESSFERVGI